MINQWVRCWYVLIPVYDYCMHPRPANPKHEDQYIYMDVPGDLEMNQDMCLEIYSETYLDMCMDTSFDVHMH